MGVAVFTRGLRRFGDRPDRRPTIRYWHLLALAVAHLQLLFRIQPLNLLVIDRHAGLLQLQTLKSWRPHKTRDGLHDVALVFLTASIDQQCSKPYAATN